MFIKLNKKGFTLVEIMIVVAIIGLLVAIALPNFLEARKKSQRSTCRANMKQIYGCVQQFLMESNMAFTAANAPNALVDTYIKKYPYCPSTLTAGELYRVNNTGVLCQTDVGGSSTGAGITDHII